MRLEQTRPKSRLPPSSHNSPGPRSTTVKKRYAAKGPEGRQHATKSSGVLLFPAYAAKSSGVLLSAYAAKSSGVLLSSYAYDQLRIALKQNKIRR